MLLNVHFDTVLLRKVGVNKVISFHKYFCFSEQQLFYFPDEHLFPITIMINLWHIVWKFTFSSCISSEFPVGTHFTLHACLMRVSEGKQAISFIVVDIWNDLPASLKDWSVIGLFSSLILILVEKQISINQQYCNIT